MFAHFTQRMHTLFRAATDRARAAKREVVEPDFMFLAMLDVQDSLAVELLQRGGVDIQALKRMTEQELNESNQDRRDLSVVKDLVENAVMEADRLNHLHTSTGHMLLSFMCTPDTGPARRLVNCGKDVDWVRHELCAAYTSGEADRLEPP
jgi:ATP-dependent Clp protease ATP-binding subunit ClpA